MIERNRAEIIERLDTSGILLEELRSQNVISIELYTKVISAKTDSDKNTILLDYLLKCSQNTLNAFIEIIQEQNQPHIAELFIIPGKLFELYDIWIKQNSVFYSFLRHFLRIL